MTHKRSKTLRAIVRSSGAFDRLVNGVAGQQFEDQRSPGSARITPGLEAEARERHRAKAATKIRQAKIGYYEFVANFKTDPQTTRNVIAQIGLADLH